MIEPSEGDSVACPQLITTCEQARQAILAARQQGKRVGLVPTMGALHAGHLSLVETARAECDFTVVTIFVNPTQFGPSEDLQKYPRTLSADMEGLAALGVDLVFAPRDEEIYQPGHSTYVEPPSVAHPLEGRCRPNHFRGVATVCLKLFLILPADVAYFGQKDYQQAVVLRQMVEDLNVPLEIQVCPTVRDEDGLALSSRNTYLAPTERTQALAISQSLQRAAQLIDEGERNAAAVVAQMRQVLADAGITRIDYVALVEPNTLCDVHEITGPAVALVAAYVGQTRLIDNLQTG